MLFSLNLIKQFIKLDQPSESEGKSAEEIADRITLSLTEVENVVRTTSPREDVILEIENKALTHRPDCFSHLGIAREIAAYFDLTCSDPLPELSRKTVKPASQSRNIAISIAVDAKELCHRYCGIVLTDIKVGPSPEWLAEMLTNVGVRPINNVVDITNYVMIELGQPLHAFDYDKVEGHEIRVRTAREGESITTLDGKERKLTGDMLVIADSQKPVGIAGVMGGANTEVSNTTKAIVLEAATFEAKNNRKTSKGLNLRTDAATRFEKNLDPNLPYPALIRAIELLQEIAGAKVASGIVDVVPISNRLGKRGKLTVDSNWINKFLGTNLKPEEIAGLLSRLSFSANINNTILAVTVPTYRRDITMQADIAEEVARIYGYDNIPVALPSQTDFTPGKNSELYWKGKVQLLLQAIGFTEVLHSPFVSMDLLKSAGLQNHEHLQLQNPLTIEQEYMRRSLLPQLLETVKENLPYSDTMRLYEINKLFVPQKDKQPLEPGYLTGVSLGDDYRTVKGAVEELFHRLHIENFRFGVFPDKDCDFLDELFHPRKTAQVYIGTKPMGVIGYVHPKVLSAFQLPEGIISFDLHMGTVAENAREVTAYRPIPNYPPVIEEITISVDEKTFLGVVIERIKQTSTLIQKVELVDAFENKRTLRITFQDPKKNLTEQDVRTIIHSFNNV